MLGIFHLALFVADGCLTASFVKIDPDNVRKTAGRENVWRFNVARVVSRLSKSEEVDSYSRCNRCLKEQIDDSEGRTVEAMRKKWT